MAHISTLGSSIYTYLDMYTGTLAASYVDAAAYAEEFKGTVLGTADADHVRLPSIREFPSVGTPANIVNVPVFGQAISSQVQGQADAPSLEVTVNYVADDMQAIHALIGQQVVFRVMMAAGPVSQNEGADETLATENTNFYFTGKVEAILVNPQLTDATTATVTISTQTDFFGPHTIAAA
jgi:hypothetical protein